MENTQYFMSVPMIVTLLRLRHHPLAMIPLTLQSFPTSRISPFLDNFSNSNPHMPKATSQSYAISLWPQPQAFLNSQFYPVFISQYLTWQNVFSTESKLQATSQTNKKRSPFLQGWEDLIPNLARVGEMCTFYLYNSGKKGEEKKIVINWSILKQAERSHPAE